MEGGEGGGGEGGGGGGGGGGRGRGEGDGVRHCQFPHHIQRCETSTFSYACFFVYYSICLLLLTRKCTIIPRELSVEESLGVPGRELNPGPILYLVLCPKLGR